MGGFASQPKWKEEIGRSVKVGLLRELFRRKQITQAQFEQLMRLHRA